jgi:hypothetical protein
MIDIEKHGKIYTAQRAIFHHNTIAIFLSEKRNEVGKATSLSSSSSPSSSPSFSSSFATILLFFLLFINDSDCCATKENAFFQIDSCPVNDNDPLVDGDGQGQQATW